MAGGWTKEEIETALLVACKHAIPESFPTVDSPRYRGFEVCPFCGDFAPMLVRFRRVEANADTVKPAARPRPVMR